MRATPETLTQGQVVDLMAHKSQDSLALRLICLAALDPKATDKIRAAAMGHLVTAYNAWQDEIKGKFWRPGDM